MKYDPRVLLSYYARLGPREPLLVGGAALSLVLISLYSFVWEPLQGSRAQIARRIALKEKGLVEIQKERQTYLDLQRRIETWEYGAMNRATANAAASRVLAKWYPGDVRGLHFAERAWNDWWAQRDSFENSSGYNSLWLVQIARGLTLEGPEALHQDPGMRRLAERSLDGPRAQRRDLPRRFRGRYPRLHHRQHGNDPEHARNVVSLVRGVGRIHPPICTTERILQAGDGKPALC